MIFQPSKISGAWIIDIEPIEDARGFFAATWLPDQLRERGMNTSLVQCNLAFNAKKGTLRGMHFQRSPHGQAKMIRATRGALFDVIIDLREESASYRQWDAVELSADNHRMFYMPEGVAHGYITLLDDTEAYYHVSGPWVPAAESGVRWDDPAFKVEWPFEPSIVSDRDRQWPLLAL